MDLLERQGVVEEIRIDQGAQDRAIDGIRRREREAEVERELRIFANAQHSDPDPCLCSIY
jgi:hypothetical protein